MKRGDDISLASFQLAERDIPSLSPLCKYSDVQNEMAIIPSISIYCMSTTMHAYDSQMTRRINYLWCFYGSACTLKLPSDWQV